VAQDTAPGLLPAEAFIGSMDEGPVAVPEPSEMAMAYHRGGIKEWVGDQFLSFALPGFLLFTGSSALMQRLSACAALSENACPITVSPRVIG